jgi:hypothetical protein
MPGRPVSDRANTALLAYAKEGSRNGEVNLGTKLPGLLSLVMGTPEYQLA